MPVPIVRPLSGIPLRPSGPIRRTCGVIKLPVTWVAPPNNNDLMATTKDSAATVDEAKKEVTLSLIVQSLWERRLFGVKPYDHMTGSEIVAQSKPHNGMTELPHPHSHSHSSFSPSSSSSPSSSAGVIKTSQLTPIRKLPPSVAAGAGGTTPHSPRILSPSQNLLPSPTLRSPPINAAAAGGVGATLAATSGGGGGAAASPSIVGMMDVATAGGNQAAALMAQHQQHPSPQQYQVSQ